MTTPDTPSTATLVAEMETYYGQRAPIYDASMGYDNPAFVESLTPVADAMRFEMRDRDVLEIACGPGFWTHNVATAARTILATDYNESTLALARAKAPPRGNVTFRQADAFDLSSVPTGFTGAFAVDFLAHVPRSRIAGLLAGLRAHLAAGARVAFCDQLPWPNSITGHHDAEGNHVQERTLPDGSRYRVIKHFFSDVEIRAIFAPFTREVNIRRFVDQRRLILSYSVEG